MLRDLRIRDLGVIADAELALAPGLNVVTGETGAGKTMLVQGLSLLLGARGDAGLVRAGAAAASVEGTVELPPDHPARARVDELGGRTDEDLVLVRTVRADGRSRAHLGGRAAPVGTLAEVGESLVAVHGQADQWRLRRPEQHRAALDAFAGQTLGQAHAAYRRTFNDLAVAVAQRDRLREATGDRTRQIDELTAALEHLELLDPQPGEDTALRDEDERLGHVESLRSAAASAYAFLAGEGDPGDGAAGPALLDLLARARDALSAAATHDSGLAGLRDRLADVGYQLADLSGDLAAYLADLDVDPARLAWVQRRRADLAALTRRHGTDVDGVLAWSRAAADRIEQLTTAADRLGGLDEQVHRLRARLSQQATSLSGLRRAAADRFAADVTAELAHLAMGSARLTVAVTTRPAPDGLRVDGPDEPVAFGRHGVDDVEILLAAGPGMPPRSVARSASGGELSRVMLAIELVLAAADTPALSADPGRVPTFVFDEVDAGVGGRAAVDVGARLAQLARTGQVLVVTHLAQVAAYADRHLVVRKDESGLVTESTVTPVRDEDRLRELARMMGGAPTPAALAHAADLLARAAASKGHPAPAMP